MIILYFYLTTVESNIFFHNMQTDTTPNISSRNVLFLKETVENLILILIFDTDTGVTYLNMYLFPITGQYLVNSNYHTTIIMIVLDGI